MTATTIALAVSVLAASLHAMLAIGSAEAADRAGRASPSGSPNVAVASSLRAVWPELERAWRESLPAVDARPSFGASRTLARQIARGAPFELFLAADALSPASLPEERVRAGSDTAYARGRLALVLRERDASASPEGPIATLAPATLAPLTARLSDDPALRLAIASPAHAPYGIAAREALEASALWPWPEGRLVIGENAAQTLQFLQVGAVDAALVPLSLIATGDAAAALANDREVSVRLLEEGLHAPLEHHLVVTADASPAALALAEWLRGARAREVLIGAGFDAPS